MISSEPSLVKNLCIGIFGDITLITKFKFSEFNSVNFFKLLFPIVTLINIKKKPNKRVSNFVNFLYSKKIIIGIKNIDIESKFKEYVPIIDNICKVCK